MTRVRLTMLTKYNGPKKFGSITLCINWLKENGYPAFSLRSFSSHNKRHKGQGDRKSVV